MTRKIIKRKIRSRIKRKRRTLKGGAPLILKEGGGELLKGLLTMIQYGFLSIITAPIYLIALAANLPLNNLNNISGKRLNEVKSGIIHNQLYKYFFYGYDSKDLKKEDYKFPEGSNYKLQGKKVFVECDDCKNKNPETNSLKGGGIDIQGSAKKILGIGGITNILGLLDKKEKMRYILGNFFDYLNNLQMKDTERRNLIHKLIMSVNNKDAIIKCIIIFNTLFNDGECYNMKGHIDANKDKDGSTFMENPTISRIPNPFMVPGQTKRDLAKSIKCITGHILYKEFGPETLTQDCMPSCPTCTLRNSVGRLASTYASSITQLLKGTNKDLDLLSEIFYTIFNEHYIYSPQPITNEIDKLNTIKTAFNKSLQNLPSHNVFNEWKKNPKMADMKTINNIIINSKFNIKNSNNNDDKLSFYKEIFGEDVYYKFKSLLCKYNIIDELKKRFVSLSFDSYYSLVGNIVKYPNEVSYQTAYLSWCNKFLTELYRIHNIKYETINPDQLFGEKELKILIQPSNPIIASFQPN